MPKWNALRLGVQILLTVLKLFSLYVISFIVFLFSMTIYYDIRYHVELEGWAPGFLAMILAILPTVIFPLIWIMLKNIRNSKKEMNKSTHEKTNERKT